jgi:hypothetical protein
MKLFISENDTTDASLYVGHKDGKLFVFDTDQEAKAFFNKEKFSKIDFCFKKLDFGSSRKIQEKSIVNRDGNMSFDIMSFRYERLINSIKSWSISDENGITVPVTKENIDRMDPVLANAILGLCDKLV